MIDVDVDGIPIDYSGIWHRVAEGPIAPAGTADNQFAAALVSPGPSPALGPAAIDLNWLVGGWKARIRDFDDDGRVREGAGEWWFSWVLEGRALQDVWISPPRTERSAPRAANYSNDRYGSTIRWLDHAAGVWRISWLNAVDGVTNQLAGSRKGDRIIFLGNVSGTPIRWSFNNIRADSFLWRGET